MSANYFGWVRITSQRSDENLPSQISAIDTKVIGVRVENGVTVGYSDGHRYDIPLDCRFVIFVHDKDQLEFVSRQISQFKEGICVAKKRS
jgi:hypothetical protein